MATASGVGSWPGERSREAVTIVRDLLADRGLPYLPELPSRGPGADLVGRAGVLLVEMPMDLQPSGWRFVDAPGLDARRASGYLREDLDEFAEAYDGWSGPLKVQVAGPWTLAASVALARGERAVVDEGACRDLAQSLAQGIGAHLGDLRRLVPGAEWVVQIDEPSLPAVLAGRLPTVSGFGRLRAVTDDAARAALSWVSAAITAAGGTPVVHCCDAGAPFALLREAGFHAVSVDATLLGAKSWESLAAERASGLALWAGVVPTDGALPTPTDGLRPLERAWSRLGLDEDGLAGLTITPTCGLAGIRTSDAVARQRATIEYADLLEQRYG